MGKTILDFGFGILDWVRREAAQGLSTINCFFKKGEVLQGHLAALDSQL